MKPNELLETIIIISIEVAVAILTGIILYHTTT